MPSNSRRYRKAFNQKSKKKPDMVGGGRRTRTFEVIRRLIYSQLPLPLGTLPRSTASEPHRRNGGNKAMDDVKTGRRWRAPGWRVYDGRAMPKSTNGGLLIDPF